MPDYGAWGPDGSLYVTDYQQAVIWRVPPGGGAAQVWLADTKLDGGPFGTAGIALAADHRTLVIARAARPGSARATRRPAGLYKVAIGADGEPGRAQAALGERAGRGARRLRDREVRQRLRGAVGPVANQIVAVGPDGKEIDAPAGDVRRAVERRVPRHSLIVANQSYVTVTRHTGRSSTSLWASRGISELIPGRKASGTRQGRRRKHRRRHRQQAEAPAALTRRART